MSNKNCKPPASTSLRQPKTQPPASRRSLRLQKHSEPDASDNENATDSDDHHHAKKTHATRKRYRSPDGDNDSNGNDEPKRKQKVKKTAKARPAAKSKRALNKKGKAKEVLQEVWISGSEAVSESEPEEVELAANNDIKENDEDLEQDSDDYDSDGLHEAHRSIIPSKKKVKGDATLDVDTIFSPVIQVRFTKGEKVETLKGRWCKVCREDPEFHQKHGERAAFKLGNYVSSLRYHIRSHFDIYQERCTAGGITMHHHAVPRKVLNKKEKDGDGSQTKLDGFLAKITLPREFTKAVLLNAVARFVVCDDQSLSVADKVTFRNCLVTMRPTTKKSDLPSTHDVVTFIHNQFTTYLEHLKEHFLSNDVGLISLTADGWTADVTKTGFLGMTAHWIDTTDRKWELKAAVIGFKATSGTHDGGNMGRYMVGLMDRVGITGRNHAKLLCVTMDNTNVNGTSCSTIEAVLDRRLFPSTWIASYHQVPCLGHVVNLAEVAVMGHITKIAAVQNATAIWEYDPNLEGNRVLNGELDVIAAIRTLSIKIQASSQRVEYFEQLQLECEITPPLKIPLHSNIRWGSAHGMLDRSFELQKAVDLFVLTADIRFGPMTVLRKDGHATKEIPWSAAKLSKADWQRVADAREILSDSQAIQQSFSAAKHPTLWRVLPQMEDLLTAWEKKLEEPRFALYHDAISDGLEKLKKYYLKFDDIPAILMSLLLHPYFGLIYIEHKWGGEKEQQDEISAGNKNAWNWQEVAIELFEETIEHYWAQRSVPSASTAKPNIASSSLHRPPDSFDLRRQQAISGTASQEGWRAEIRAYHAFCRGDHGVTRDTDLVIWWQNNAYRFPTIAMAARDMLAVPASSVPCERLFSAGKLIATDRRARLGLARFEELQIMKAAWKGDVFDLAAWNSGLTEDVDVNEFEHLLCEDVAAAEWDREMAGVPEIPLS